MTDDEKTRFYGEIIDDVGDAADRLEEQSCPDTAGVQVARIAREAADFVRYGGDPDTAAALYDTVANVAKTLPGAEAEELARALTDAARKLRRIARGKP